ncbi:MAG: hypothetical protein LPK03_13040, partial [Pontibacter sp.]|nr:hypothetical protein [Pontibacter sp.]
MKKFNTLAFTLGLLFYVATSVLAATATDTLRQNPELRKEVRAYTRQNIIPVLREQRIAFEKQLSAADKQKIARLRQEQQRLHLQAKELRESFKASRGESKTLLNEAEKAQLKALRQKQKQVVLRTRTIAGQYRSQLQAIQAELADEKETWTADLKAIYARHNITS